MGQYRCLICSVPGAHVGLDEVRRESDPRVTMGEEVVDGFGDTVGVVGSGRWCGETLDLVARQDDDLAGSTKAIQKVRVGGRRDRDDAIDVIPRDGSCEVRCRDHLVAAEASVECLDQHHMPIRRANCAGDTGDDLAVVEATRHGGKHPYGDRLRHTASLRPQCGAEFRHG